MTGYSVFISTHHVDFDLGGSQQLNMTDVSEARIILVR